MIFCWWWLMLLIMVVGWYWWNCEIEREEEDEQWLLWVMLRFTFFFSPLFWFWLWCSCGDLWERRLFLWKWFEVKEVVNGDSYGGVCCEEGCWWKLLMKVVDEGMKIMTKWRWWSIGWFVGDEWWLLWSDGRWWMVVKSSCWWRVRGWSKEMNGSDGWRWWWRIITSWCAEFFFYIKCM